MPSAKLDPRLLGSLILLAVVGRGLAEEHRVAAEEPPPRLPVVAPEEQGLAVSSLDAIDGLVEQAIEDGQMPGAVVLIGYRGATVFHRAYGQRQVQPEPLPMQLDTVFDLASLTKPVATATCLMKLAEQGAVGLDDPVGQHIPAFAANGKEAVTIRQLLVHTAGLIPDNPLADYEGGLTGSVENFLKLSLNYEPGTKFRYSDVGFLVLAELIREKTGSDIAAFSREVVFQPLGMSETSYLPDPALQQRAAATQKRDGRWMVGEVHDPRAYAMGGVAGHAGLFSTASDLAIYAQAMLSGGSYRGVQILQPETVQTMTAAYEVPHGQRGLGWDKRSGYSSNRGKTMSDAAFGHGGFTGTAIWIDPELDLFVIFLSNRLHPDGKGSVNALAGEIGTIAADAASPLSAPRTD